MKKVFEVLDAQKAKVEKELDLLNTLIENKEDKGLAIAKSELEKRSKLQKELNETLSTIKKLSK